MSPTQKIEIIRTLYRVRMHLSLQSQLKREQESLKHDV